MGAENYLLIFLNCLIGLAKPTTPCTEIGPIQLTWVNSYLPFAYNAVWERAWAK